MSADPPPSAAVAGRRCRARPRPAGSLRPTDVIGAFFLAGIVMVVAGAAVGVINAADPWPWGRWLALHLLFVGGVSQLVLGASQFFAGAFLATEPPGRARIRAQLALWNAGTLLLAAAVPLGAAAFVWIAVAALLGGLLLYCSGLVEMQRRSLQSAPWAVRWYLAAAAALAIGIVAGAMMAAGVLWPYGNLLAAHMALNVGGWFGAAIVGTLHTFYPSLTKTTLRLPRLQAPTFAAWIGGVTALAIGYGGLVEPVAICGWIALTIASAGLLVNVLASLIAAPRPVSLSARTLALAQVCLLSGLVLAAVGSIGSGSAEALSGSLRGAVGTLVVVGWVGITVAGSLLHLLAVVVRVRDFSRPIAAPRPRLDAAVTAAAAVGVFGLVAAELGDVGELRAFALIVLLSAYLALSVRITALVGRVLRVARPSL